MAITECSKGHVYDTDQYAACPYCNSGNNIIDFGNSGNEEENANKTVALVHNQQSPSSNEGADAQFRGIEDANKTVGIYKDKYDLDPVVGWLVCIEGPEKGKDYRIWAKINTIGRSERMDICIRKDRTISKENHARIAYDPKHNVFRILPDKNTNNIYVNDEPVYSPLKLNAYDIIELGKSKVLFLPLCSSRFTWEDGIIKED